MEQEQLRDPAEAVIVPPAFFPAAIGCLRQRLFPAFLLRRDISPFSGLVKLVDLLFTHRFNPRGAVAPFPLLI